MNLLSSEQEAVVSEQGSCVVIAKPGSGKTHTLSYKIKQILDDHPSFKGVVAISFTNKASDELKDRVLRIGAKQKGTFFGTIDRFCLFEMVIPFLRHEVGAVSKNVGIKKVAESQMLSEEEKIGIGKMLQGAPIDWALIKEKFLAGEVYLELAGILAIALFDRNKVLKKYLRAKYTHVFIDEYQDSGFEQHELFLRLHSIGLIGVAVGDLDQSIYRFAKKSSKHLFALTENSEFGKYSLTQNYRCHPSIAAYSVKLISPSIKFETPKELRVYSKHVDGDEVAQAEWIESIIPKLKEKFEITNNSEIAILARSNSTASIIANAMKQFKVQLRAETPLDALRSQAAAFFSEALECILDYRMSINDLVNKHANVDDLKNKHKKVLSDLIGGRDDYRAERIQPEALAELLISSGRMLLSEPIQVEAELALREVLGGSQLSSYDPTDEECLQMMTIHKSKGLEFSVVLHLDLHQWIIPSFQALKGDAEEMIQSRNLHYVGITRARKACILVSSTQRTNSDGTKKKGERSEFMTRSDLAALRKELR